MAGQYLGDKPMPPEPVLCAQLGVSRTVLREVVKALVAKGLVSTGPKVGTRVLSEEVWNWMDPDVLTWKLRVGLSPDFLRTLSELRRVVEPSCVRLATERATPAQLVAIEAAFVRMQEAVASGVDDLSDDFKFHHLLLQASGNRLLGQMSILLRALLRTSHQLLGRRPAVPNSTLPWHSALLRAVLARDGAGAQQAMLELIDAVEADLAHLLRSRPAIA